MDGIGNQRTAGYHLFCQAEPGGVQIEIIKPAVRLAALDVIPVSVRPCSCRRRRCSGHGDRICSIAAPYSMKACRKSHVWSVGQFDLA